MTTLTWNIVARDMATGVFGKIGKNAGATTHAIGGAFSNLSNVIGGELGATLSTVGSQLEGMGGSKAEKLMAVGGVATGVGVAMMSMGSGIKSATAQLDAAVTASGNNVGAFSKQFDNAEVSAAHFGFGAADAAGALTKLTEATNSPTKALQSMTLVENLAASQHESLAAAAAQVARVYGGSGKVLKQYGITMATGGDKTKDATEALAELSKKLNGQASASVDSFSGRVKVIRTEVGDWADKMGGKLGPVVTAAGPALMALGAVMDIVKTRQAAAALATEAMTAATEEQTVAQEGLDVAESANPLGLIVLAIAAVVAALVLFFTKTKLGKEIIHDAFKGMGDAVGIFKHAITGVFDWLKDNWKLLLAIITGPIGLAVLVIKDHWTTIKDDAKDAVHWITDKFGSLLGFFKSLPGKLAAAAKGLFDGIGNAFIGVVNFMIRAWDALHFAMPSFKVFGKTIGGFTLGLPQIPQIPGLATGGTVVTPGLTLVGERGPELLNLGRGASVVPLSRGSHGGGVGGGSGTTEVHLHVSVMPGGEAAAAREMSRVLRQGIANGTIPAFS